MARDLVAERRDSKLSGKAAKKAKAARVAGRHLALPHDVLDSLGFRRATVEARSMLLDIAGQLFRRGDEGGLPNGGLMADRDRLHILGWTSASTITKALKDLVDCGLLIVTRQGGKNRPTLYGVPWQSLEATKQNYVLEIDRAKWAIHRDAYHRPDKPERAPQADRTAAAREKRKVNAAARRNAKSCLSDIGRERLIGLCDIDAAGPIGLYDSQVAHKVGESIGLSDRHSLEHCHLGGHRDRGSREPRVLMPEARRPEIVGTAPWDEATQ